jgi:hypothetical protein
VLGREGLGQRRADSLDPPFGGAQGGVHAGSCGR